MSRCGSASALSSFVILWGVAALYSFLAAMGFACAWRGRSGK